MKMKKIVLSMAIVFSMFMLNAPESQSRGQLIAKVIRQADTTTFKVYGKCGMCKKRIEAAAAGVDGVEAAAWNIDSGTLTVTYDAQKISEIDIHKAIADVGHDTEKAKATDETYNKLMGCCKYERPEKVNVENKQ